MVRATVTRPLRVVHLVGNNVPIQSFGLFARLANPKRISLTIGSVDGEGPLQRGLRELGVPTFSLDAEARRAYPSALLRFASMLRRGRADIVQTHLFDACLVGLAAARLARVPVAIFTAHHSHEIPLHDRWPVTVADRLAAGFLSDHVIAPSAAMKDTLIAVHKVRPDKISVIPHGFDLARFNSADGAEFRARHRIGDSIVFGSVSRYFWIKNIDGLIRAFAAVAREEPSAKLVVVGDGDRSEAMQLIERLGLETRVVLCGPLDDVAEAYAAFDLLVQPALAESFGQAIVEGMAMRKPVLSTPVGVAPEVIEDGRSGFLAAGPDPAQLDAAMMRALARRGDWAKIGEAARQRVLSFTADRWVKAHEDAYESWLSGAARGGR
jgi:glycosyltransferase involved in cell wall biosynthesis